MKKETKVLCPQCGAEFAIADKEITMVATVVGKDSGLGTIYPALADKKKLKAQERIDALCNAGVDVSNLFAMRGANGDEYVASKNDGKISILDDDDPIFKYIMENGTVPNRQLFRRWVMAQMFHMMSYTPARGKAPLGVTEMIHRLGYEYQWKMLLNELYAQMKMEDKDKVNFADRNRWFNAHVVLSMANEYMTLLNRRVDKIKEKKCKGVPYKRVGRRNIFVADLRNKLYNPLYLAIARIKQSKNISQLYAATKRFNELRLKMPHTTHQNPDWIDAYKGSGAFFTMQNLIRFHNCIAIDDEGKRLDKYQSLAFLSAKAEAYENGEGWRLLGVLKKMLEDNNINIKKKIASWHKK